MSDEPLQTTQVPQDLPNSLLWFAGVIFLALAKAKNLMFGYSTPTAAPVSNPRKAGENFVAMWEKELLRFNAPDLWRGTDVLELGPGENLFAGEVLLERGCQSYAAIDAFRLASVVPQGVQYLIDPSFRVDQAAGEKQFDRFLSWAAFEHFDDVADTLRRLTKTAKPGALLSILVDFKTHSRWIREVDPNNIYRYPDWLYRLFQFRGQPNRVRPNQYVKILEALGWTDIAVTPVESASSQYLGKISAHVSRSFLSDNSDMGVLVGMITAKFDPQAN